MGSQTIKELSPRTYCTLRLTVAVLLVMLGSGVSAIVAVSAVIVAPSCARATTEIRFSATIAIRAETSILFPGEVPP